jgi:putative copper resistance protein D
VTALLGYPLPAAPTLTGLLVGWQPDGFALLFVVVAAALYGAGLRTLGRRGDPWPLGRTLAWYGGLLVFAWATAGGLGRYAAVLFSAHMGAHMLLAMIVPILLVLGAPVTLALRTLPASRVEGEPGPRQLLLAVLHSRVARFLTHPLVASAIFVASFYAVYFTPIFETLMGSHLGHIAMEFHFLVSGALFFHVILAVDPSPRRLSPAARLWMLFVAVPFHAFFSVALMSSSRPVAAGYFASLHRPYATDLLADQRVGGGLSWAFGELPILAVLAAVFVQWVRADQREARRLDRAADRAEASAERHSRSTR